MSQISIKLHALSPGIKFHSVICTCSVPYTYTQSQAYTACHEVGWPCESEVEKEESTPVYVYMYISMYVHMLAAGFPKTLNNSSWYIFIVYKNYNELEPLYY